MQTVLWNLLCVFLLPFIAGVLLRLGLARLSKIRLLTLGGFLLFLLLTGLRLLFHGSELLGLLSLMALCCFLGMLLAEGICYFCKK